jgi:hypothetical protein
MDPETDPVATPTTRPDWLVPVASVAVVAVFVVGAGIVLFGGDHGRGATPHAAPRDANHYPFRPALALAFVRGHTETFHVTETMRGRLRAGSRSAPFDMRMEADVQWHIGAVRKDGSAMLTIHTTHVALDVDGEQAPVPAVPPTHLRLTSDGRVLLSNGTTLFRADVQGPSKVGTDSVSAVLPAGGRTPAPGTKWSRTVRSILFGQPLTYTAHSTLLRRQKDGPVQAAVVKTDIDLRRLHLTIQLSDLAALEHLPRRDAPAGASVTSSGWESIHTISWIDPSARRLLKTVTHARYSVRETAHGLPARLWPQGGGIRMTGSLAMTLERI